MHHAATPLSGATVVNPGRLMTGGVELGAIVTEGLGVADGETVAVGPVVGEISGLAFAVGATTGDGGAEGGVEPHAPITIANRAVMTVRRADIAFPPGCIWIRTRMPVGWIAALDGQSGTRVVPGSPRPSMFVAVAPNRSWSRPSCAPARVAGHYPAAHRVGVAEVGG